ncbi:hypothetical protein KQ875_01240 [Mycoplasma zalophi]|uniref:DUF31 domain-containing protein n=1 Tax=Mycoplasma zalophi TaxID=191287 RepID=A0ABS6DPP1_9MOLU|nr:hypothetical protein [Mycoplasma zalophi]MBU4692218.1 hypothetical protein [Mycoplasma zalophi]
MKKTTKKFLFLTATFAITSSIGVIAISCQQNLSTSDINKNNKNNQNDLNTYIPKKLENAPKNTNENTSNQNTDSRENTDNKNSNSNEKIEDQNNSTILIPESNKPNKTEDENKNNSTIDSQPENPKNPESANDNNHDSHNNEPKQDSENKQDNEPENPKNPESTNENNNNNLDNNEHKQDSKNKQDNEPENPKQDSDTPKNNPDTNPRRDDNLEYGENHNISPIWHLETERNISEINTLNTNKNVFELYNKALSKRQLTSTNVTFDNKKYVNYRLLKSSFNNKNVIVEIASNAEINNTDTYKLKYLNGENSTEQEISLTPSSTNKYVLVANINTVTDNYKIKMLKVIRNNSEEVRFMSEGEYLLGKEIWKDSSKFKVTNEFKWSTWNSGNNIHSFAVTMQPVANNYTFPSKARLVWLTKNNELQSGEMSIEKKLRQYPYTAKLDITFNVSNIKKIMGIEVLGWNEHEWKWLGNISNKITIADQPSESESVQNLPSIYQVEKQDSNLNILVSNPGDFKNVKFEIKSTNPFINYSNIFEATKSGSSYNVNLSSLPKNVEEFIITRGVFDNEIKTYPFVSYVTFKNYQNQNKNYKITEFNIYKDETNKNLYGSIAFDFDSEDFKRFDNKSVELVFTRTPQEFEKIDTYYWNLFLKEQKVIVPFKKWNKFNLNGFYEEQLYTLKSVRIVESINLNEVISQDKFADSINSLSNKEFSYTFDYGKAKDDYLAGETQGETKDSLLIKDKNNEQKTIEYSLQNHYAAINYERENWYKAKVIENDNREKSQKLAENKFTLIHNGKQINTHFISPRELINNLKWNFNDNFTETTITKDISAFKNLNSHENDAIITLGFEFDPKQREITDLVEVEPFVRFEEGIRSAYWPVRNVSKSFVYLSVPYKKIKDSQILNDLNFEYLAIRHTANQQQNLKNLITSRYRFSAELKGNSLTFKIQCKSNDTKIFERIGDHYLSLNNSAFLGSSSLFIYYSDINNNTPITYEAIKPQNIKTIGLDHLNFEDSYKHKIPKLDGSSTRLYKEDKEKNVENARQRTFNFDKEKAGEGTWAIIGKVNPDNPNDYKFFVSTNQHVWGRFNPVESKIFDNPRFDTALPINRPEGGWSIHKADTRERFYPGIEWNDVKVKVDLINAFDNDSRFPDAKREFKNNYGDINVDEKWGTYSAHTNNSLSHADMVIGIADFKDIFNVFETRNGVVYYHNKSIDNISDDKDKSIRRVYDFFMTVKNLQTLKPSIHNLHLSSLSNLTWTLASFPVEAQYANHDTNNGKRYREYLIGNLTTPLSRLQYGGVSTSLPAIHVDSKLLDLNGGSSGTMLFDSEGNATSLYTETATTYGAAMVIDTQAGAFLGDGKTTQNPGSFYEKMRILSHLYPDLYDHKQFSELPNWVNEENKEQN